MKNGEVYFLGNGQYRMKFHGADVRITESESGCVLAIDGQQFSGHYTDWGDAADAAKAIVLWTS